MKIISNLMVLALFLSNQEVQGLRAPRVDDKSSEQKASMIKEKLKDTLQKITIDNSNDPIAAEHGKQAAIDAFNKA